MMTLFLTSATGDTAILRTRSSSLLMLDQISGICSWNTLDFVLAKYCLGSD